MATSSQEIEKSRPVIRAEGKTRMAATRRVGHGDIFARVIGFLVFLLGVGIILGVLCLAFDMFKAQNLGLVTTSAVQKAGASAPDLVVGFGVLILRIILLFLGSISGSLVANKGIRLYFTGAGSHGRQNGIGQDEPIDVLTPEERAGAPG